MPDILVLAKAFPPVAGGVETYSERLVREYLRKGWSCTVLTQTSRPQGWRRASYPEGQIQLYDAGPGSQAIVLLRWIAQLAKLRRKQEFDLVHATTWRPALAVAPFYRSTPLVITVHGREVLNYPAFLRRPMRNLLSEAATVVTVSEATMSVAKRALGRSRPKGTWVVSFNGISYPEEGKAFLRAFDHSGRPIRLLSLSRLVPRKNVQGCLAALSALLKEGVENFEYWIGGRGPMLDELQSSIKGTPLEAHVRFLGYVPESDVASIYQQCDAFLHPQTNVGEGNDFEGFGLVIADAMSMGCAVLAGSAGGPRDFIEDGQTGLLVDGLDSSALLSAIRSLVVDHNLRERLSKNGQSYALDNLSWEGHLDRILATLPIDFRENRPNE